MRNRLVTSLSLSALITALSLGAASSVARAQDSAPVAAPAAPVVVPAPPVAAPVVAAPASAPAQEPAPAAAPQTPPPAPKPPDAPAVPDNGVAPPPPPAPLGGITITGAVEVNFTHNFNRPFTNSNTYLYNQKHDQFALNLADLRIGRAATPENRAGFFVRLIDGEVKRTNFNPGESTDNILEAYGTLLIPLGGRDLKFDAGQFVTHVGYETIDIGTNNFFSRNFLFQYPSPFYNAGVRASYPLAAKTTLNGYIYNRYNGVNDTGNSDLAPGFQIIQQLSGNSSLVLNGLTSRENILYGADYQPGAAKPRNNGKQQSIVDLIYTAQATTTTKFVLEGLYRFGKDGRNNSYGAYGVAGYGIFTLNSGNVAALRAEYYRQNDAIAVGGIGVNQLIGGYPDATEPADKRVSLGSLTASYELKSGLFPGVRTLFEARYDYSGGRFFAGKDVGTFRKNQTSLTIGQVYNF